MELLDALRSKLGPESKDLKLNIQTVLSNEKLSAEQAWGCAVTSALFIKDRELADALLGDAVAAGIPEAVIDDARAAAAIMAMTTTYYRFRHMVDGEKYAGMPPRLRMNRMMQVATDKATFELFSTSCAVLAGCEMCINAHAASILKHGLAEEHVHEAARIAAVVNGFSTALSLVESAAPTA